MCELFANVFVKSVWSAAIIAKGCKVGEPKCELGGYERRAGRRERSRCKGEKMVDSDDFRQNLFFWLDAPEGKGAIR